MTIKTQNGGLPRRVKFFYGAGDTGFSFYPLTRECHAHLREELARR